MSPGITGLAVGYTFLMSESSENSQSSQSTTGDTSGDSHDTGAINDEDLPEDLQPEENPLAREPDDEDGGASVQPEPQPEE